MTDVAIKNAVARRDQLGKDMAETQQRLDDLRRELAKVDKFIESYREFANLTEEQELDLLGPPSDALTLEPTIGNPRKEDLAPIIREMILEAKKPLSRNAVFAGLELQNIFLKGKDPKMVLSTMLWRMPDKFVRLQGHGYWLADTPYEPASYLPSRAQQSVRRR